MGATTATAMLTFVVAPFKWDSPFPQRPFLIPRKNIFSLSQVIAVLSGFAVVQLISDVFYTEDASEDHEGTRFLIRAISQLTIATLIVRALQYRSKKAYQAWLATYEESWRPDDREWRKVLRDGCRTWVRRLNKLWRGEDRLGQIELR